MSTRKKFISGFSWQTVNVVTQVVLQLIFMAVMHRKLSPEDFGVMAIALVVVGFIEIFSQIGIGPAIIQKKEISHEQLNGAFYISLVLGISFAVFLYFISTPIAAFFEHEPLTKILRVIGLSFIISAISIVPKSMIIKKMEFKKLFFSAATAMTIGNLIIGITLAFMGFKIWAYVFALLSQNLIMTIMFWIQHPIKIGLNWHWKTTKGLIRYGGGSTLFNMFNYAATKADTIIVGKFSNLNMDMEETSSRWNKTGLYDRSVWLMSLPITVLGKLSDSVLFSGLSSIQDEKQKLQRLFLSGTYLISLIIIPACVFMIFFARELVFIFLGHHYETAIPVVQILFVSVAIRSLIKLCDAVVRALDAVFYASAIKFVFLIMICLGTYFGLNYGLKGVAFFIVVSVALQYIMMMKLSLILIELSFGKVLKKMIPGLIIGFCIAIFSLPAYLLLHSFDFLAVPGLLVAIAINGLGLLFLVLQFPWLFGKGDDNLLLIIINKLPENKITKSIKRKLGA